MTGIVSVLTSGGISLVTQKWVTWQLAYINAMLLAWQGLPPPKDDSWDSIVAWLKTCARGSVLLLLENFEDATARMSDTGRDPLTKVLGTAWLQL